MHGAAARRQLAAAAAAVSEGQAGGDARANQGAPLVLRAVDDVRMMVSLISVLPPTPRSAAVARWWALRVRMQPTNLWARPRRCGTVSYAVLTLLVGRFHSAEAEQLWNAEVRVVTAPGPPCCSPGCRPPAASRPSPAARVWAPDQQVPPPPPPTHPAPIPPPPRPARGRVQQHEVLHTMAAAGAQAQL
jgi:hypothetical protein